MINKVILVGKAGKDADIKHFQNDNAVLEFSLATTESWKDKEGKWQEKTEWHQVKMFGKNVGKIAERILKGLTIYVEGKISTRSYDDKDGNKRYVTEIVADQLRVVGKPQGDNSQGSRENYNQDNRQNYNSSSAPAHDDDLPF